MLLKSFCTAKETTDKKKTLPTELQKMLANDKTTKGLISKIYKQFIERNIKKANKKWAEDLNRHFCKEADGQEVHEKIFNIANC